MSSELVATSLSSKVDALNQILNRLKSGWSQGDPNLIRFLALKAWISDVDATLLSPPVSVDRLWHKLILDTKLYAAVQKSVGTTIHHRPKQNDDDAEHAVRYLRTAGLWISMYGQESWDEVRDSIGDCTVAESEKKAEDSDDAPVGSRKRPRKAKKASLPPGGAIVDNSMIVHVLTLTGKIHDIRVPTDATVEDLKDLYRIADGVPVSQSQLIFAGKELEDHKRLADYNIQSENTIHHIFRMRGC